MAGFAFAKRRMVWDSSFRTVGLFLQLILLVASSNDFEGKFGKFH